MKIRQALRLLREAMSRNNSLACCGLDPDYSKMPSHVSGKTSEEERVYDFLREVIDLTNTHICAYKAQKAFFDVYRGGHELLKETISYSQKRYPYLPVFVDAKIGEVENTMAVYLKNIFDELGADGVVVNPYLGDDVLEPFGNLPNKAAIVTVKTSNLGAAIVQDIPVFGTGRKLWVHILETMVARWNVAKNLIPVIASTADEDLSFVRRMIPDDMLILFAGYGAQGGTTRHLGELLDSHRQGVFVNSSRGILYPYAKDDPDWRDKVVRAVVSMKADLNMARGVSSQKFLLLLGPSGVGKSAIMKELRLMDSRFTYISPLMTRALRLGETDKVPVNDAELDEMERQGKFLAVNRLYGIRYATPMEPIEKAFREGSFPLLDWPVQNIKVMLEAFSGRTFTVYIVPPDFATLERHLADGRDLDRARYEAGVNELQGYYAGTYHDVVNYRVVNPEQEARKTAEKIYDMYLTAIGERQ